MQSRFASKAITRSSNRAIVEHEDKNSKQKRFSKCLGVPWVFSLSICNGERNVSLFGADILWLCQFTIVNQYCIWRWCLPLLRRNRPRFSRLGTDTRRGFAPFVFNPVGPSSQESILHNPRQRFETVWNLSEQDKTTSSNHQSKGRSLTAKNMATKSLKNRYACSSISLTFKLAITFCE